MDILELIGVALGLWGLLAVFMAFAWLIQQRTGNSGWVDTVWTFGVGVTGIAGATAAFSISDLTLRMLLLSALVFVWAARLAGHITLRTTQISDDPRYKKLREKWGAAAPRNMFWLLQAQALLSVPIVLSITLSAWNPAPLFTPMDLGALALFCIAIAGSALSDFQLTQFKQRNHGTGKVCDTGLWAWSRHPNYFFEWLIWLSLALFALDLSGNWPLGYIAIAGPVCMYWLLRYVSGVPPLEAHMVARYGDAYATYQRTTSVFFPLPRTLWRGTST